MSTGPTPPEPEVPDRPLDPPVSGDRLLLRWTLILLAASLTGAGWLAARASTSGMARVVLDALLNIGFGSLIALTAYRVVVRFPFRTLDLLAMVVVLSLGIKLTLDALQSASRYALVSMGSIEAREQIGTVALWCLLTSSVLLAGAALGLRYCVRLKLDAPLARLAAIVHGMLFFPASVGLFAFPALVVSDLFGEAPNPDTELTATYLLLFVMSLYVMIRNGLFLIRSMALESEVEVRPPGPG